MLYAVKNPKGKIIEWTVCDDRREATARQFRVCCVAYQDWESTYWKKWDAANRAARKLGWRIVRVKVTEVE